MTSRSNRIPSRVLSLMTSTTWAIRTAALERMMQIARREVSMDSMMAFDMGGESFAEAPKPPALVVVEGVAIIPFIGPGFRYASLMTDICGAASYQRMGDLHAEALATPSVKAILMEVNTPGGEVTGCADYAAQIRAGCALKPTVAFIDGDASSAGYWVTSACEHIVISRTGSAGCIGVVAMMQDRSRADEMEGIENIEIVSSATPNKRPDVTTDEGRAQILRSVDAQAAVFMGDVARYRGVDPATVSQRFNRGDIFIGRDAVRVGLADEVGTMDEVLAALIGSQKSALSDANPSLMLSAQSAARARRSGASKGSRR